MGTGNSQGAVANRETDALRGTGADVPGGQHARESRLQGTRVAIRARPQSRTNDIGAGQQIAIGIATNVGRQPFRGRFGPDEYEYG